MNQKTLCSFIGSAVSDKIANQKETEKIMVRWTLPNDENREDTCAEICAVVREAAHAHFPP